MPLYTTQGIFVYRGTVVDNQHIVQWGVSPCGEVTHGLDCSGGIGSLLNAPHCAFTKLATDTKQNTTAELSHVFSTGKEVRRQGNYHGLGRDVDKICSKRKL